MKKMFLLILSLIVLGAVSVDAQVTIGSASDPHEGAVLDIQSTTQGLRLPTVAIADAKKFQLADEAKKATAVGMLVYNTNADMIDGQGAGLYVWTGSHWNFAGSKVPVTSVAIAADGGATSLKANSTLQLTATVSPSHATDNTVRWDIVSGTAATVNSSGLVTGIWNGNVTVRANSKSDQTIYKEKTLTVNGVISVVGSVDTYAVYCYPDHVGCWMTDNSKEGVPYKTQYPAQGVGARGYYYANGAVACPNGYHFPSTSEYTSLITYINGASASAQEKDYWNSSSEKAGYYYDYGSGAWSGWGSSGYWWGGTNEGD